MTKRYLNVFVNVMLPVVLILVLFRTTSCHKKVDIAYNIHYNVPNNLPSHCTNLQQDFDETGVDCGGIDCPPCAGKSVSVSCITQPNQAQINTNRLGLKTLTLNSNHYYDKPNNIYFIQTEFNNGKDTLTFAFDGLPNADAAYFYTTDGTYGGSSVYLGYTGLYASVSNPWYPQTNGQIVVKIMNGVRHIYVCHVLLYLNYNSFVDVNNLELIDN